MSVQINQLYSLRSKMTWGVIALHFLKANKAGGTALAHFFRTRFGEPRRQVQSIVKREDLIKLSGGYRHGECPFAPIVILMFCDVQAEEKKWVKCAFHRDGRCAVVDYGITFEFTDLLDEVDVPVKVLDWEDTPAHKRVNPTALFCWIDEGGREGNEKAVREFCARQDTFGRFFPSKGAGGAQLKSIVQVSDREVVASWHPSGVANVKAYHFSHNMFAMELYQDRIKKHDEILLAMAQGLDPVAPRLHFPEHPDEQFYAELASEHLAQERIRGVLQRVWKKKGPNDFGDGVKGCLGMWYYIKQFIPESKPKGRDYVLKQR